MAYVPFHLLNAPPKQWRCSRLDAHADIERQGTSGETPMQNRREATSKVVEIAFDRRPGE